MPVCGHLQPLTVLVGNKPVVGKEIVQQQRRYNKTEGYAEQQLMLPIEEGVTQKES